MKELRLIRPVENRAKWLLHELHSYEVIQGGQHLEEYQFKTSPDDKILGICRNYPNSQKDLIIVTNLGIYVSEEKEWKFLDYTMMEDVRFPLTMPKLNWCYLMIQLKNEKKFILPVKNMRPSKLIGFQRDIWAFEKFLSGIISGLNSKNAPK